MKHLARYVAILALCSAVGSSAYAVQTHLYGQATIEMSDNSQINWNGLQGTANAVAFASPQVSGVPNCATPGCEVTYTREGTATFRADPGLFIDKVYLTIEYGGFNNFSVSSSSAFLYWDTHGGTYSGTINSDTPCAYSGSDYRCWMITGPSTGVAVGTGYANFTYRFGGSLPVLGHYDVQAASFSIDLKQVTNIYNPSQFEGTIEPTGMVLSMSFVSAPVPEPETWAMLLAGLGLLGAVARKNASKALLVPVAIK